MSEQQLVVFNVLARLTQMRSSLSADEQVVLDAIVTRSVEDEVSAHSMSISMASFAASRPIIFNVSAGAYEAASR
jgi:hypothetical protein